LTCRFHDRMTTQETTQSRALLAWSITVSNFDLVSRLPGSLALASEKDDSPCLTTERVGNRMVTNGY
jgi:hypothetical protein